MRTGFLALAFLLLATAAQAACPRACTVTNSSTAMFVIGNNKHFLAIDNESGSSAIACAFSNGTATLNTAGSYTIQPGQTRIWNFSGSQVGNLLPAGNLNCISAGASTPATIEIF